MSGGGDSRTATASETFYDLAIRWITTIGEIFPKVQIDELSPFIAKYLGFVVLCLHFLDSLTGEIARILVEFLEVAITSIVYLKGFYPSEAFERRRYMNVVVHRARHPQLAEYIHTCTAGLLPFLQKGQIERVTVIFYDKENVPVEKFVFKTTINQSYSSKVEEDSLEFALRAFLIKLTVANTVTRQLPAGGSWEITAYFRSLPQDGSNESQLWIPTDTKQWMQPPDITPLKSMNTEPLKVQLYLEHPSPSEPKNLT